VDVRGACIREHSECMARGDENMLMTRNGSAESFVLSVCHGNSTPEIRDIRMEIQMSERVDEADVPHQLLRCPPPALHGDAKRREGSRPVDDVTTEQRRWSARYGQR